MTNFIKENGEDGDGDDDDDDEDEDEDGTVRAVRVALRVYRHADSHLPRATSVSVRSDHKQSYKTNFDSSCLQASFFLMLTTPGRFAVLQWRWDLRRDPAQQRRDRLEGWAIGPSAHRGIEASVTDRPLLCDWLLSRGSKRRKGRIESCQIDRLLPLRTYPQTQA
ncbi:unnamed protein product [Soboliphyme baturini]|uniref:Uncharacterized protein n=1 Tax=Soboliphyme baturini TaxID=241478 RepID=A0A183IB33_9BILA|nr:unnamed protein product [Soboliphyme baturini]